ncbi:MAG: hypothetical protein HXX13_17390 [Bacteroidetes bacterium]|nr:hypothetical protein [Bacteroidota bacterium]
MNRFCLFLSFCFLIISYSSFCQQADSLKAKKPGISWGGFTRADALYDTRQVVDSREGYLLLYPRNISRDANGNDINAHGSFNQYAMTARLFAKVQGPDILHATAMAYIEGDFTGASNIENNSFRLRHAYTRLSWKKITLLAGQYWHPLDLPEMFPDVVSLNTGAPFRSYSRQPQIRVDVKLGVVKLVATAASQRDYVNMGPEKDSMSSIYLRNSGIPNLNFQVQYNFNHVFCGAGFDFKKLVPRLKTDLKLKSNEKVNSYTFTGFMKISLKPIVVKAQFIYGQNLTDHSMVGGYGVISIDPLTDHRTYKPLRDVSAWVGLSTTGKKIQYSLFAGYLHNLGCKDSIIAPFVYARGIDRFGQRKSDLNYAWRITPMFSWLIGNLALVAEVEITTASYGQADKYYYIRSSNSVTNIRTTLSVAYNF